MRDPCVNIVISLCVTTLYFVIKIEMKCKCICDSVSNGTVIQFFILFDLEFGLVKPCKAM